MAMRPAIVKDALHLVILSRLDVQVDTIKCSPNLRQRKVLCHWSLLEGSYLFSWWHLYSGKGMLMEGIDDNPHPKPEPQGKTTVTQSKVKLQPKNIAPCPHPCQHQTKAHKSRNHPLMAIPSPDSNDVPIVTVRGELAEIQCRKKKKLNKWLIVKPSVGDH